MLTLKKPSCGSTDFAWSRFLAGHIPRRKDPGSSQSRRVVEKNYQLMLKSKTDMARKTLVENEVQIQNLCLKIKTFDLTIS